MKTTIETKIAKNGNLIVKVDDGIDTSRKFADAVAALADTTFTGRPDVEIIVDRNDDSHICDIYKGGFNFDRSEYVFTDNKGNEYCFWDSSLALKHFARGIFGEVITVKTAITEANPDDYAITPEAMEIAINAEIEAANATEPFSKAKKLFEDMKEFNLLHAYADKGYTHCMYYPEMNYEFHTMCDVVIKMIDHVVTDELAGHNYSGFKFASDAERCWGSTIQFHVNHDDEDCRYNVLITHDLNSVEFNRRAVEYFINGLLKNSDVQFYFDYIGGNVEDYILPIEIKTEIEAANVTNETDGTEDDADEELPDVMPVDDDDTDDELIDENHEAFAEAVAQIQAIKAEKIEPLAERFIKLSFAVDACFHFYLNNLKKELFGKYVYPAIDEGKEIDAELAEPEHKIACASTINEYRGAIPLLKDCQNKTYYGYSYFCKITGAIIDRLTDKEIADELKKIVDELGIDLLQSGRYDFNPALFADEPVEIPADEPNEIESIEARMSEIAIERGEWYDELDAAEADEGISQSHIDYLKDGIKSLTDEYQELWAKLEELKKAKAAVVEEKEPFQPLTIEEEIQALNDMIATADPDKSGEDIADWKAERDDLIKQLNPKPSVDELTMSKPPVESDSGDVLAIKLVAMLAEREANQPAEVKTLNAQLAKSKLQAPRMWIRIVDDAGNHRGSFARGVLSSVHIEYNAQPKVIRGYTLRYFNEPMRIYETFAQVTAAVEQFKTAITANAKEFTFPTVDELNQPAENPSVENLKDSLGRAMEIAHQKFHQYEREGNQDGMRREIELYSICADAINQLKEAA